MFRVMRSLLYILDQSDGDVKFSSYLVYVAARVLRKNCRPAGANFRRYWLLSSLVVRFHARIFFCQPQTLSKMYILISWERQLIIYRYTRREFYESSLQRAASAYLTFFYQNTPEFIPSACYRVRKGMFY